jgi:hypothetical protein
MREYIVGASGITITGSNTLVIINPTSGRAIQMIRAWASQRGTTTSEQVGIGWGTKATAFGTYISNTPKAQNPSDPSSKITGGTAGAAGTSGTNASAEGAGTYTEVYPDSFNNVVGWIWTPNIQAGEAPIFSSADSLAWALKLTSTPTVLTNWSFGAVFREIG